MQSAIDPHAPPASVDGIGVNDKAVDSTAVPSIEAMSSPPTAPSDTHERRSIVVFAVIGGLIVGLIGNALFYGKAIGVNFPLFMGICAGAGLLSLRVARKNIHPRNLFLLLPMAFFAIMIAVRADGLISFLNLGAVIWIGCMTLYYVPQRRTFDNESIGQHTIAVIDASFTTAFMPLIETGTIWSWLRERRFTDSQTLKAFIRGALLTLPILAVFVLLLASADAVFDDLLTQIANLFNFQMPNDLFFQGGIIFVLGWFAAGALIYTAARRGTFASDEMPPPETQAKTNVRKGVKSRPFTLGMIESSMILGSLDALFGLFVAIQFAYFFGGNETVLSQGITYSNYARRGFFELVAVAVLTICLAMFVDWTTVRQGKRQNRIFQSLIVVMVALNLVMLASAAQRMWLYEQAYGFTQLRVYVHVAIAWMSVLFAGLLGTLFRIRRHIFSLAIFLTVIGYGVTLNLMNVELYIAENNIARIDSDPGLDVAYLWSFSADAAPAFIDLYQTTQDAATKEFAGQWLIRQYNTLSDTYASGRGTIFSAHAGRDSAFRAIDAIRATLPAIDWRYFPPQNTDLYSDDFERE